MNDTPVDTRSPKFLKAMAQAKLFRLSREDRLDLAEYLLRRDVVSWKQLTEAQLDRILDALDGFEYVARLLVDQAGTVSTAAAHSL